MLYLRSELLRKVVVVVVVNGSYSAAPYSYMMISKNERNYPASIHWYLAQHVFFKLTMSNVNVKRHCCFTTISIVVGV